MIIDLDFKPWLLTDPSRPALGGAFYDKEAHALKITNGKALAILPVLEDEADESGIIPADALKEAAKLGKGRPMLPVEIKVKGGTATLRDGRSWPLINAQFPEIAQVIPNKTEWTRPARIMLSVEMLNDLVEAAGACGKFGHGIATLEFDTCEDGDATPNLMLVTTGKATTAVLAAMRFKSQKEKKAPDIRPCLTCNGTQKIRLMGQGEIACACAGGN